jgi:hypothetical protein
MAKWSEIMAQVAKLDLVDDPEVVAIVYNSTDGGMTTSRKARRDEYDNLEFLFVEQYQYPADEPVKLQLVFQLKESV